MKNILKITQHNITKLYNPYEASQCLKRKILTLAKQLETLKDLRHHPLFISHFIKIIKFIESGRYDKACNSYKQIIFSLLKTLQTKKIDTYYKDTVDIRSPNEIRQEIRMQDRQVVELREKLARKNDEIRQVTVTKDREINELRKALEMKDDGSQQDLDTEEEVSRLWQVLDTTVDVDTENEEIDNEEMTQLQEELDTRNEAVEKLQKALEMKEDEVNELQGTLDTQGDEVNQLQEELDRKNQVIKMKEEEFLNLLKNLHSKTEANIKLEHCINDFAEVCKQFESGIQGLENQTPFQYFKKMMTSLSR